MKLGNLSGLDGLSLSLRLAVAGLALPLQVVGSRGEINAIEGGAVTTSNLKQIGRSRAFTGTAPSKTIAPSWNGFFVDTATSGNGQTCAEVNASNGYVIRMAIEIEGIGTVRATFGGEEEAIVPPGSERLTPDPVPASAFGLEVFPPNTQYWTRAERQFVVGQKGMFHQTQSNNPTIAGESWFVASAGAASQLMNEGPLTTANGWAQQAHVWLPYCTLGHPASPMMAVSTFGASIENGVGDGQGDGLNGAGGYMRRMLANVNGKKIARVHLAKSGETARSFLLNSAKRRAMLPFTNVVLSGHGGNDYSTGRTLAQLEADWLALWALLRQGAPDAHIEHYALSPKTDGPWTTAAGQTPRIGFETGGAYRDPGNAWCAAQVAGNPNLDAFINLSAAQADSGLPDRWRVDLGAPTTDGTHPLAVITAAMAMLNAPHMETLRTMIEGA